MEATPRVHRHRHRRSDSRHHHNRQELLSSEQHAAQQQQATQQQHIDIESASCLTNVDEGSQSSTRSYYITRLSQEHERQSSSDALEATETPSQSSQQTVVLINGHAPPLETEQAECAEELTGANAAASAAANGGRDSPTLHTANSSRNSSGDALSLRETLQQLPPTTHVGGHHHHRHHHRNRTHSPHSQQLQQQQQQQQLHDNPADSSFQRGILGFMDRELKQCSPTPSALSVGAVSSGSTGNKMQSFSDPQASPAQRSIRSRSSIDKSPRRKRSKSESRRRRERKLGEMEVRQANETLMKYLKQCSEMNDASLSGELEIDKNFDERRVQRKTKSQRDKRGHLISKLYTAGGISSILKELSDDIVPADGEEIYNPFTPVVSPTEDETPARVDKIFLQTSSGYRPVEHCYYKHSFVGAHCSSSLTAASGTGGAGGAGGNAASGVGNGGIAGNDRTLLHGGRICNPAGLRPSASFGSDTRCLLDGDCRSHEIRTNIQLACVIQRIWLLITNICHGLLAGLALSHLLFVLSSHQADWTGLINRHLNDASDALSSGNEPTEMSAALQNGMEAQPALLSDASASNAKVVLDDYASFANIYINTFYCLAIVCMVSVFDRMDILHWNFSNAAEFISFRWLIIAMIYIATIILTICSDSIDERWYLNSNNNLTISKQEMLSNSVSSIWSSLSVTRSIGALCGWLMIGLSPHDMLYEHLIDLTKYQVTNN